MSPTTAPFHDPSGSLEAHQVAGVMRSIEALARETHGSSFVLCFTDGVGTAAPQPVPATASVGTTIPAAIAAQHRQLVFHPPVALAH
jgi:hypothetical protein